ncbi:MAG: IS110 family transposase [Sulfurimonadaceae bacterium]
MENCIGIDVSKASINVHISKNVLDLQVQNSVKGFKSLYSKLKKIYKKEIDEIVFIFEPTGSYSEGLKKFCYDQNIKCFIINPKQFSNYAKALGIEIKNDIEDARVLAKALVIAKEGQVAVPQYDEDVERIKELMSYYKFTIKQTTQQRNHLEALESKDGDIFTIKELKKSIKESKGKEQRIIDQIQTMIDSNAKYKNDYENIISIMGVGKIGAIALLHLFLKYPHANQRQITSLTGLNPVYKQSGTSVQSRYKISKSGSRMYRGSLFMATMSAIRYDDNFKAFYERLKENGKHTTQAQIAVMRKIVITAHSLYKNDTRYDVNFSTHEVKSVA